MQLSIRVGTLSVHAEADYLQGWCAAGFYLHRDGGVNPLPWQSL